MTLNARDSRISSISALNARPNIISASICLVTYDNRNHYLEKFNLDNFRESYKEYFYKFNNTKLKNTTISIELLKDTKEFTNEMDKWQILGNIKSYHPNARYNPQLVSRDEFKISKIGPESTYKFRKIRYNNNNYHFPYPVLQKGIF